MAITVDPSVTYQVIDGVGASAAQAEAYTDAAADFWFTSAGIGLSINRMNINNAGLLATEPWYTPFSGTPSPGSCLANAQKIAARGARVNLMTQLTPDAWGAYGALPPAYYGAFADFVRTALDQCAASGVSVYAVAPHNEVDMQGNQFGLYFTPDQYWDWVHNHVRPAIAASSQPGVKLLMPDAAYWTAIPAYVSAFSTRGHLSDFDFISGHDYAGTPVAPVVAGKRAWQTEYGGPVADYGIADGITWATRIHNAFVVRGLSSYQFTAVWDLDWLNEMGVGSGYGLADGASDGFAVRKRAWAFAHYGSRFIEPGMQRVSVTSAPAGVLASAYGDAYGRLAVVLINGGAAPQPLQVAAAGIPSLTPWLTDAANDLAAQSPIYPSSGSFSYTMPASSIVTLATPAGLTAIAGPVSGGSCALRGHRPTGRMITVT